MFFFEQIEYKKGPEIPGLSYIQSVFYASSASTVIPPFTT
jgi:hypothetical protein